MSAVLVYVTVPSVPEAEKIAEAAVVDRLAACANILPGMKSIYHWDGKIERADETILIFKTRDTLFPALESCVKAMHSYQTPCIVALPLTAGNEDFLRWITAETKP